MVFVSAVVREYAPARVGGVARNDLIEPRVHRISHRAPEEGATWIPAYDTAKGTGHQRFSFDDVCTMWLVAGDPTKICPVVDG